MYEAHIAPCGSVSITTEYLAEPAEPGTNATGSTTTSFPDCDSTTWEQNKHGAHGGSAAVGRARCSGRVGVVGLGGGLVFLLECGPKPVVSQAQEQGAGA